jgi:hypothetical protein
MRVFSVARLRIRLTALGLVALTWGCSSPGPHVTPAAPDAADASDGASPDAEADAAAPDATLAPETEGGVSTSDAGDDASAGSDPFGVREIYPTKPGGREWFMDRDDVMGDGVFESSLAPMPNADGTWYIHALRPGEPNQGARMDVTTPPGMDLWLDIEMTGYVRLISSSSAQEFAWRTTSGTPHTNACEGYAYYATLLYSGERASVLKEVWHPSGYITGPEVALSPTASLEGRWVGFKAIRYNVQADTKVRVELWLDEHADGQWRKLVENTDDGWVAANPFPAEYDCDNPLTGEPKTLDQIMNWPYPLVTFRADNAEFDFDKLSVREIVPPDVHLDAWLRDWRETVGARQ